GDDGRVSLVSTLIEEHFALPVVGTGQERNPQRLCLVDPGPELVQVCAEATFARPRGTVTGHRTEVAAVRGDDVVERLENAPVAARKGSGPRLRQLGRRELSAECQQP